MILLAMFLFTAITGKVSLKCPAICKYGTCFRPDCQLGEG